MKGSSQMFAIITGASSGIGREIAVELAKTGVTVGLVARSEQRLQETKSLIEKVHGTAEIFILDLRDVTSIYNLAKSLKSQWKKLDILVNVAGIYHDETKAFSGIPFTKYSNEQILTTYEVGTNGTTFLTHALLPLMQPGSHIINISGTFETGAKGWLPYFVSKRAIEDFTVGLAEELKDQGIFVNCVSPSDVATETYKKFFPEYAKDAMDPAEIGTFIIDLTSQINPTTGNVFVLKKDKKPYTGFHT